MQTRETHLHASRLGIDAEEIADQHSDRNPKPESDKAQ